MSLQPPVEAAADAHGTLRREATKRALRTGRVPRILLWSWATLSGAAFAAALGGVVVGALALVLGVLGALRAERKWAETMATRVLADSFAAISLGRLVDAEAALDALAESSWLPVGSRRLVSIQKGIARVRRGDLPGARAALDDAIAPEPAREEVDASYQITGAVALRAFVNGALGDVEAATRDVERVRASAAAGEDALARASLTEAMIAGRQGERDALRRILDRDHDLLHEHCHPRERAIVRALERQVHTPTTTPYRIAEAADTRGDEPPVETWMARVAPHLVAFEETRRPVTSTAAAKELREPRPSADAVAAVQANRVRGAGSLGAWAALGALVVGGLFALSSTGAVVPTRVASGSAGAGTTLGIIALAILATAAVLTFASRRWAERQRDRSRLAQARKQGEARTEGSLEALRESRDPAVAAQARLLLATAAEREGRWEDVLRETEEGLRALSSLALRRATGLLAPDLVGLRAFALAVTGRADEAEAELATIAVGYPHYPRARFRVLLVEALRRERYAAAREAIDGLAADLPLSVREELLVDLVRTLDATSSVSQAEAARLRRELARDTTRRWIEGVAPALLAAIERGAEETIAPGASAASDVGGPRVELGREAAGPPVGARGEGPGGEARGAGSGEARDDERAEAEAEVEALLAEAGRPAEVVRRS